jgi:hypothetical protein
MKKSIVVLIWFYLAVQITYSQSIPVSGDQYHIYGPNSTWGEMLQIGGNGRTTTNASVVSTNGNLHLDSKNGHFTYINYYSKTNTLLNSQGGNVGIGTSSPNAGLDIKKEGVALEIDHTISGGHSMIKFNSVVNNGSDKGFILFQDETSNSPGTGREDVRLTMGVFNDFRSWSGHSDELWFQGGGRLVQNVGKWDSELNTLIGTPSSGITGGYEWRVNNSTKMRLSHSGDLSVGGTIKATEIKVEAQTADFVFEDNYHLKDLTDVEAFILTNKHLPEIPSAAEMEEAGVNLAEMNKLLLMKVEELTLYSIKLEKEVKKEREERRAMRGESEKKVSGLEFWVQEQEERLAKLEALLEELSK